ncbi:MAG TPA: S26 family signal peptidase, partial [Pseudobdellovibrionaceae bacterium]|nr:S26 family signal peptidase [Pseudobdellovibrionaceae bacterium]
MPTTIRYAFFLALLVVIAISARYFAFSIYEATKDEPSLGILHGDVLLAIRQNEPLRGQLVFDSSGVLARVLAVEGDRIEVRGKQLWVNEEAAWEVKQGESFP